MKSPGLVDITFYYESPPVRGVVVDALTANIYDSVGNLRQTYVLGTDVELVEENTPVYYYQITDFDTSNYDLFPDGRVDVEWLVGKGSASPVYYTSHSFVPVAVYRAAARIVVWTQSTVDNLQGYYIESKTSQDVDYNYIGTSMFTTYIDRTRYVLPDQLNNVSYRVTELLLGESPNAPEMIQGEEMIPESFVVRHPVCLVYGQISQIDGSIEEVDYIRFYTDYKSAPSYLNGTHLLTERERIATIDRFGQFSTYLPQGAIVTCEIPQIGYIKRFTVPDKEVVNIEDVGGFFVETHRAP